MNKLKLLFPLITFCFLINYASGQNLNQDSLFNSYSQMKDDSSKIRMLRELGWKIEATDTGKAKNIYIETITLSQRIGDKSQEAKSLISLGNWYSRLSHYETADSILRRALAIATMANSKPDIAKAMGNIGNVFYSKGEYDSCLSYFLSSGKIVEELKDFKRIAVTYGNVSNLYYVLDDIPNAKRYAMKADENLKVINDERGLGRNYSVLSHIYAKTLEYDTAIEYCKKAIFLLRKTNDLQFLQIAYENIATNYFDTKQFESADAYVDSSLVLSRKLGDVNGLFHSLIIKGKIATENKNYTLAEKLFEEALPYAQKDGNILWLRLYYQNMDTLSVRQNKFKEAHYYLEQYHFYNDSIKSEDKMDKIAELETKYQTEKKQIQITQLEKEKQIQQLTFAQKTTRYYILTGSLAAIILLVVSGLRNSRQKQILQTKKIKELEQEKQFIAVNSILQGQEAERTRMAKDLHDGLGGMLSGIKLNLSSMKGNVVVHEKDATLFSKSINQLDNAISEMRRVAHNMMPEALLKFGLTEAVQDYCDGINESNTVKIKYTQLNFSQPLAKSMEVIIYRIIQELTTNAIKHAEAKNILIQLSKNEDILNLTVEDDGKGFDTKQLANIKGTGLQNVQSRVDYLKGIFTIESEIAKGTSVNIEIPV